MTDDDARMTRKEVAAALGVSERTVQRMVVRGVLSVQYNGFREPATYSAREVKSIKRNRAR